MKRTLAFFAICLALGTGCTKNDIGTESTEAEPLGARRACASQEVLEAQLASDPSLQARMDAIERFTKKAIDEAPQGRLIAGNIIEIPVVFNVLYNTAAGNLSLERLQSQIDVLNRDFSATNSDYNTANPFQSLRSGDMGIRFVIDNVVRKSTTKSSWRTDDAMKKSTKGGINPTSPSTKLNIWVCNLSGGILGYAQFPGGALATDGVVLDDNATGVTTTGVYNLGRTATHEVGHWLNLRHIWGDDGTGCTGSDQVGDTPNAAGPNYGCPTPHTSCSNGSNGDMYMNYMDYTDDRCMYMFTVGQKSRVAATFVAGGPRATFAQ